MKDLSTCISESKKHYIMRQKQNLREQREREISRKSNQKCETLARTSAIYRGKVGDCSQLQNNF